jgi:diguanylate cyclase (GGDEF)-like protein
VRALLRKVDLQASELQAERSILQDAMIKKIEAEERLLHEVLHDPLTDLPNRRLFAERLRHAIDWGQRHPDGQSAVVYLDLDRFKVVNDTLGHNIGDQLLIEVAQRLTASIRNVDTVARMGGDEFAILLEDLKYAGEVFEIVSRLQENLAAPFESIDGGMVMTASIGIVMNLLQYQSIDDIIRDADIAMYGAKGGGKNCYRVFDTVTREQTVKFLKFA